MPSLVFPFMITIKGDGESQVADAAVFLDCRLCRQPLPIDEALTCIGIDGEIADLKGSEVLEKMAAL